jgi:hypothetical protein
VTRSLTLTICLLAAAVLAGCDGAPASTPTPLPPAGTSPPVASPANPVTGSAGTIINASGSTPPTGSPGITGSLTNGSAQVTLTGGINSTVDLATLTNAVWSPPPGAMVFAWGGPKKQTLSLGGASFTSQQPTSDSHVLSFAVEGSGGDLVQFRSAGGECLVTINPALPNNVGGVFTCRSLTSGDLTVQAQGTFSATG